MTTIGNIGIGLFVLILVWLLALALFVFAVRIQSNLGWIGLAIATGLTVILVLIPTEGPKSTEEFVLYDNEFKDYTLIYKNILLVFLSLSVLIAGSVFFMSYCIESIRPKPIGSFYLKRSQSL